jgi:hypothetical protein
MSAAQEISAVPQTNCCSAFFVRVGLGSAIRCQEPSFHRVDNPSRPLSFQQRKR